MNAVAKIKHITEINFMKWRRVKVAQVQIIAQTCHTSGDE